MYKYIGVILLIDKKSNDIIEVDFSIVFSDLTKKVLKKHIEGFNVKSSFNDLTNSIKKSVSIPSIGAIIQALRSAIDRYEEHIFKQG